MIFVENFAKIEKSVVVSVGRVDQMTKFGLSWVELRRQQPLLDFINLEFSASVKIKVDKSLHFERHVRVRINSKLETHYGP